ncbi:tapasin isoform X3 [Erinaceus europaeus]|uniref:Tapasin isoform X3 n=1 Tax=Erinaceus europaeus TaxID=9365 RepID=A0ABM3X9S0_ERIEU|nr:tapasin isoform X3 [Erinaceus europaeus]
MKTLSLLFLVSLGLATSVSAGPAAIECWFVEDAGGGRLVKKPAALLLRQGPGTVPARPDLDPKFYLKVHDPAGAFQAAFKRYPREVPQPHCEMSYYMPLPTSASWASGLTPERKCPRALDGTWFMVSVSSPTVSLSSLMRPQSEPQQDPVPFTMATEPPKVSLTPAPIVWAAPGEAPPELVCQVSHFYPSEGLEVEWELRGGPEGSYQKAKGQHWLSALRHHSDGSISVSSHLRPLPVTAKHHGMRYACRVHHSSLPALGRSAQITLEVAGLSAPSLEDGVGLFLSAFLLLGLIKALGSIAAYQSASRDS